MSYSSRLKYVRYSYSACSCKLSSILQFVEKILEEGTKSPRTIRLAALHLCGLWLAYPNIIQYYIKELKLLTFYGSGMISFALVVQLKYRKHVD